MKSAVFGGGSSGIEHHPFCREEIEVITSVMKFMGITPYLFLGIALELSAAGYSNRARELLAFARSFNGIFFPEGSAKEKDYRDSVELLIYITGEFPLEFASMLKSGEH